MRSQGVQWVHLHPRGGEKFFFWPNLQEKCVSAPPQDTKCTPSYIKSQFLGQFLLSCLDLEVYLHGLWFVRAMTKKKVNFFGKRKCTPRQNPGYAYVPDEGPMSISSRWASTLLSGTNQGAVGCPRTFAHCYFSLLWMHLMWKWGWI